MRTNLAKIPVTIAQDSSVTTGAELSSYKNIWLGIPAHSTGMDNTSCKLTVQCNIGTEAATDWKSLYTAAQTQIVYATSTGGLTWNIGSIGSFDAIRVEADTTATAAAGSTYNWYGQR